MEKRIYFHILVLLNREKILSNANKILADTDNYLMVLATTEVIVSAVPRY